MVELIIERFDLSGLDELDVRNGSRVDRREHLGMKFEVVNN